MTMIHVPFKKLKKIISNVFYNAIYYICISFVCVVVAVILYYGYILFMENVVLQYYVLGISLIVALALSITYINRFNDNKEKNQNDSYSPERQDNGVLKEDIFRKEPYQAYR